MVGSRGRRMLRRPLLGLVQTKVDAPLQRMGVVDWGEPSGLFLLSVPRGWVFRQRRGLSFSDEQEFR